MMNGVFEWYFSQVDAIANEPIVINEDTGEKRMRTPAEKRMILNSYKQGALELREAINIQNTDKEMTSFNRRRNEDEELCLANPYSRITCFVLYLYSMEFGSLPLYAEVNRAACTNPFDDFHVRTLGPFAAAMDLITTWAESGR